MTNRIGDSLFHFGANKDLVLALQSNGVEFIIIGGLAVSWWCPTRTADDMDLLVSPSKENSKRLSDALTSIGLTGFGDDSFCKGNLQVPIKAVYYAEILTPSSGSASYDVIASRSVAGKIFNLPVLIASRQDIIKMKMAAAAEPGANAKHEDDIRLLGEDVA